jgi:HK97 family phage prohead protease
VPNGMRMLRIKEFKDLICEGKEIDENMYVNKFFDTEIKEIEGLDLRLQFAISTGSVDRDNDTIDPFGWELRNYRKNPVVLWAHNYDELPVGRSIREWVEDDRLKSEAEFTSRELYPFGFMVLQMLRNKFLNTTSVGFKPKEWMFADDENREFGVDFIKQELLEYSIVPVPSNPEALVDAKGVGIDLEPLREWAEKTLDGVYGESGLWLPRSKVEKVYDLLNGEKKIFDVSVGNNDDEKDVDEPVLDEGEGKVLDEEDLGQEKQVDEQRFEIGDWVEPIVPHMEGHDTPMQIVGITRGVFYEVLMPGSEMPHRWYGDFELEGVSEPDDVLELSMEEVGENDPLTHKNPAEEEFVLELKEESDEEVIEVEMMKEMVKGAVKDAVRDLKMKITGRVD